jgi:hypothetical protein
MLCNNCTVNFTVGPIAIQNTQFEQTNMAGAYLSINRLTTTYGLSSFVAYAQLFDQYNNSINVIDPSTNISATLSGNFMNQINLNT